METYESDVKLGSYSKVEKGWQTDSGVANYNMQRIQDSLYYQNFSYSLRSRVSMDKWDDAVSTLSHSLGYLKFSDMQLDSINENSMQVGLSTDITSYGYGYYYSNGELYTAGSGSSYGNTYASGDIIGVALDCDNNKLYFSKNGTWQNSGDPTSGSTGTGAQSLNTDAGRVWGFALGVQQDNIDSNFGGCPSFSISSGNADGNGYGNFEYAPPSGYLSLCTKNLGSDGG